MQIEPYQGSDDDTAVNMIRLLCKQAVGDILEVGSVESSYANWGNVQQKVYCPDDYWIVAYRVRIWKWSTRVLIH